MLLDRFATIKVNSRPISRIGFDLRDDDMIWIDQLPMRLTPANNELSPPNVEVNASNDFVVTIGTNSIALGVVKHASGDPNMVVLTPSPADSTAFRIGRSIMSWPTPLDINFMTGHSPSWKRHLYYQLAWQKQNGSRLEIVWRYEQYFYESWASGFMIRDGTTGLIRARIRPAKLAGR